MSLCVYIVKDFIIRRKASLDNNNFAQLNVLTLALRRHKRGRCSYENVYYCVETVNCLMKDGLKSGVELEFFAYRFRNFKEEI